MSIIYDALQKTQRNRSMNRDSLPLSSNFRMRVVDRILMIAIILLLMAVAYAYRPLVLRHFSHSAKTKSAASTAQQPLVVASAPSDMVLNGVLMSDENKTALINNQFYHVGDIVNGMKIVSIELNNVKLQHDNQIVILRTTS